MPGMAPEKEGQYCPQKCFDAEQIKINARPDRAHVSTSHSLR